MTQEEKGLVFKDLCARLPYGVKVWYKYYPDNVTEKFATSIRLADEKIALSSKFNKEGDWYPVEEANELLIKPYLRPMSSMTDEEYEKLLERLPKYWSIDIDKLGDLYFDIGDASYPDIELLTDIIDWLNAHHFDYRGLIEKNLAIKVTEENNPYKE